jgi:mRNA deadenylase 3'-5' endonuclease subunit Ccr4
MSNQQPSLLSRQWNSSVVLPRDEQFIICTWNVLADSLALSVYGDDVAFPHTDQAVLLWEYRAPLIKKQLCFIDADVFCLQEVDKYQEFFEPLFQSMGYASQWTPKIDSVDGILIAWKQDKFQRAAWSMYRLGEKHSQVALLVLLKHIKTTRYMMITTTHLKSKPPFRDLRTTQGIEVLQIIKDHQHIPPAELECLAFICGDFNDTPDAPINVELENQGYIDKKDSGSILWTTWKKRSSEVKRTIDYIFSPNNLTPLSFLMPPLDEAAPNALPSAQYPSDHIAMAQVFKMDDVLNTP